jgi:hypothetical protein
MSAFRNARGYLRSLELLVVFPLPLASSCTCFTSFHANVVNLIIPHSVKYEKEVMPVMVATGKAKDLKNTVFQVFGYQHG